MIKQESSVGRLILLAVLLGLTVGLRETAVSAYPSFIPKTALDDINLTAVSIASGFTQPVDIANAGDDRLFIVEQSGIIRIIDADKTLLAEPFLDINSLVDSATHAERGLLGLAFHPDYPNTPYFYVNYTAVSGSGDTVIARYTVSGNPNIANAGSAVEILRIDQPDGNHNGGDLNFGPQDGYLYIAMGDGGSSNDSGTGHNIDIGNAQDMTQLLGKVLRININADSGTSPDCGEIHGGGTPPYTIPDNNPFVAGGDNICNEIWASGLRNPWRASFDSETFDYYIADVGQGAWEEVNIQFASSAGGENYGWRCYEGNNFTNLDSTAECDSDMIFPFDEYPHGSDIDAGFSITGGYVYRGSQFPTLNGIYIYADYATNNFWIAQNSSGWTVTPLGNIGMSNPSSFGEGCDGELYVAGHGGTIYQIQDSGASTTGMAALDQFVYLPLVMGGSGNSIILTCSG